MTHAHNRYRIPPDLHVRLEHEAKLAGVSVRWLVLTALSEECGRRLKARRGDGWRQTWDDAEREDWWQRLRELFADAPEDPAASA